MSKHLISEGRHKNSRGLNRLHFSEDSPDANFPQIVSSDIPSHLTMLVKLGSVVPFYDESNAHVGYWDKVLLEDILVRLALVITHKHKLSSQAIKDLFGEYKQLHEDCLGASGCLNPEYRRQILHEQLTGKIIELCSILDQMQAWCDQFNDGPEIQSAFHKIFDENAIKVKQDLTKLYLTAFYQENPSLPECLADNADIHLKNNFLSIKSPDHRRASLQDWFLSIKNTINKMHDSMKDSANRKFSELLNGGYHTQPMTSLLIAFLRMYEKISVQMNNMPSRYLNYFYKDWLGFSINSALPDTVDVVLVPAKEAEGVLIPTGTLFNANSNKASEPIHYKLKQNVFLSKAQLETFESVNIATDSKNKLRVQKTDRLQSEKPWPLLCDDKLATDYIYKSFGLSGNLLKLKQGNRKVSVTLTLKHQTPEDRSLYENILSQNKILKGSTGTQTLIRLTLSTSEGPQSLSEQKITIEWEASADENISFLHLRFTLSDQFPELVQAENPYRPILEFQLGPEAKESHNPVFEAVYVENIRIDLTLENQEVFTFIDDQRTFSGPHSIAPFASPLENNSFIRLWVHIMSTSLRITNASLKWTWKGMPVSLIDYFAHYYRHLTRTIKEKCRYSLLASLTPQNDEAWDNQTKILPLIGQGTSCINIHVPDKLDAYPVKDFLIKLVCPPFSFGHSHYGQLMAQATRIDAKRRYLSFITQSLRACIKVLIIPFIVRIKDSFSQMPYLKEQEKFRVAPLTLLRRFIKYRRMAETLKVNPPCEVQMTNPLMDIGGYIDFNPADTINQNEVCFSHIYPDGSIRPNNQPTTGIRLWPEFNEGYEIHLGFSNLNTNTPLSLLWHIPVSTIGDRDECDIIHWSVLSDNQWIAIVDQDILCDQTESLTRSGVITLRLPGASIENNTIRKSGIFWLRARVSSSHQLERRCLGVYINGAALKHRSTSGLPDAPLPTGSVKKLISAHPGITKINQIYSSYGGRKAEEDKHFHSRVARSLRTRRRSVAAWDIEHMILDRFPEISCVKCLSSTLPDGRRAGGHITVAVATKPVFDNEIPKIFISPLLKSEISSFLKNHSSSDQQYYVIPPVHEEIYLSVWLKLNHYADPNRWQKLSTEAISKAINLASIQQNTLLIHNSLDRDDIVSHLENLSFIDGVSRINFGHKGMPTNQESSVITPLHPGGFFTPSRNYQLNLDQGIPDITQVSRV